MRVSVRVRDGRLLKASPRCIAERWTEDVWSRRSFYSLRGRATPGSWYDFAMLTVFHATPVGLLVLVLTLCVSVSVCEALGAGQLDQPREQRGD